jgi:uncharacterized membrane protein
MTLIVANAVRLIMVILGSLVAQSGVDASLFTDEGTIETVAGIVTVIIAAIWGFREKQLLAKRGVTKVRLLPKRKNQDVSPDSGHAAVQEDLKEQFNRERRSP